MTPLSGYSVPALHDKELDNASAGCFNYIFWLLPFLCVTVFSILGLLFTFAMRIPCQPLLKCNEHFSESIMLVISTSPLQFDLQFALELR